MGQRQKTYQDLLQALIQSQLLMLQDVRNLFQLLSTNQLYLLLPRRILMLPVTEVRMVLPLISASGGTPPYTGTGSMASLPALIHIRSYVPMDAQLQKQLRSETNGYYSKCKVYVRETK